MRRALFFLGLAILLAGLSFLGISSIKGVVRERTTNSTGSWTLSANLTEGNTYILDIRSTEIWRDDFTAGGYEDPQPVDMKIFSPSGGETKLQAFFIARQPTSPYYKGTLPILVFVEYGTVDSANLEVDRSHPQVRFAAKQGGNYTASIIQDTLNWTRGPPKEMILDKEVVQNQNSYTNLFQGSGVACLFTGIVVSAFGVRATKKMTTKRKKTAKK